MTFSFWLDSKIYIAIKEGVSSINLIEKLKEKMPRARQSGFQSQIMPRYIRRQTEID